MQKPLIQIKLEEAGYTNIHTPDKCAGQTCIIHNPSDHHMLEWPLDLRLDKGGPAERQCVHRVGHPDPDSVAFLTRVRPLDAKYIGIHGCDGCCQPPEWDDYI